MKSSIDMFEDSLSDFNINTQVRKITRRLEIKSQRDAVGYDPDTDDSDSDDELEKNGVRIPSPGSTRTYLLLKPNFRPVSPEMEPNVPMVIDPMPCKVASPEVLKAKQTPAEIEAEMFEHIKTLLGEKRFDLLCSWRRLYSTAAEYGVVVKKYLEERLPDESAARVNGIFEWLIAAIEAEGKYPLKRNSHFKIPDLHYENCCAIRAQHTSEASYKKAVTNYLKKHHRFNPYFELDLVVNSVVAAVQKEGEWPLKSSLASDKAMATGVGASSLTFEKEEIQTRKPISPKMK